MSERKETTRYRLTAEEYNNDIFLVEYRETTFFENKKDALKYVLDKAKEINAEDRDITVNIEDNFYNT